MNLGRLVLSMALVTAFCPIAAEPAPDGAPAPAAARPDPCALLKSSEIEAVQGQRVVDTKSSRPERSLFAVSQCFFTLPTFSRSISLEVVRRDPSRPDAESPRKHWRQLFHEEAGDAGREKEDAEEPGGPLAVPGVGDEAFWTGDGIIGALYVLKGDIYLRLSLGGAADARAGIERSKALAEKALSRL